MSISIIGAGNVGQALSKAFTAKGEKVVLGVPDPAKYAHLTSAGVRVSAVADAIAASEVVILAVPYAATESIVRGVADWGSKILVDATNPLAPALAGLSIGTTDSGAEAIARAAHNARVVKAFNTTGAENMADSRYTGGLPMMPVCGDDAAARQKVMSLASVIGFDAVDMGPLLAARYLEPFAMTWIHLAFKQCAGRSFAFARLQR
ncbi:MAG: NADPH-dependent F420 reductase [Cupriavidus sp.]|nr:NADPH-dependent F420 reductase [Cupriavidus sp.]